MVKVGCIVGRVELLVGLLGGSVLDVDLSGVENNIMMTSVFWLQVMLVESLGVPGHFALQLYCGTLYKLEYDYYEWNGCCSILMTLLTPCATLLFDFHAHPNFHSHDWLPHENTWGMMSYKCFYHHAVIWWPQKHTETSLTDHDYSRAGHGPQYQLMQL